MTTPTKCGADWGVCPDHGNTLAASGGSTRCKVCGRTWDYDRVQRACEEPPAFRLVDQLGFEGLLCAGHALDARGRVTGGTVIPL